jgi:hypothetical protein
MALSDWLSRAMGRPSRGLPPWFAGAAQIAAAAAMGTVVGLALGTRLWAVYVGLFAMALLGLGGAERAWQALSTRRPPRSRDRFRIVQGGRLDGNPPDDDRPRWLH